MKENISVGISGTGFYVPEKILKNSDLEKIVETTDEWIRTRTGIRERHIADINETTSDLASKACLAAIKDAGLTPLDIDLLILCTLSPDMFFPSTACQVQKKINLKNAACFDLFAACSGFNYGLFVAESFVKTRFYKNVLLVGAEVFSRIIDWEDRNTCVLFGDGAGAVVLSEHKKNNHGILSHHIGADGTGAELLYMPAGGSSMPATIETVENKQHYLKMNGKEIYKFATKTMVETIEKTLKKVNIDTSQIDLLIPHQANIRILEHVAEKLSIPLEKIFINVDKYGNTSAASIPIALCEALAQNKIKSGDIIVTVSFGAGLTWGASAIRW